MNVLRLGVDGIGMAMLLLTAIIIFAWCDRELHGRPKRVKEYYASLMALVTGVFGVFMSLDLFFYYFFYELAVIPMFLLIGIWGSTTKTVDQQYATMKLVLMLSARSGLRTRRTDLRAGMQVGTLRHDAQLEAARASASRLRA